METPKSRSQVIDQAGQLLRGLSLGQRGLIAGGALLVGLTIWAFVGMMDRPKMSTLYSGLKPSETQAMGVRLAAKNIAYEVSPDGASVLVPAAQLDMARLETAAQGLPRSARMGFELFDTPNWTGSDFSEKVNYQRALEGELERTLQTLSDVESVRVHLVMPHESLFTEQEREAKAAVILKTRGSALSEREQRAIPQLVASAVEGLRPENVTVIDADDNTPLLRRSEAGGSGGLEDDLNKTLLRTLEPVVGEGHVRASVHVEYDLSTSDNTEEVYDPKADATLTEQKSEENAGGGAPAGVPGTASNVPGGTASAGAITALSAATETQSSHSESITYAVSKSVRHTTQPPGRVKRVAAAVLVDDAVDPSAGNGRGSSIRRKRTPEEIKELEQLAWAAIGLDIQRGDTLTVENLSFEQRPLEQLSAPTKIEVTRRVVTQWSWVLRYVGIAALFLIVYLLILRPVKKQILVTLSQIPGRVGERAKALADTQSGSGQGPAELLPGIEQSRHAAALKKQLTEKIKTEPALASRLVQSWIREEKQR